MKLSDYLKDMHCERCSSTLLVDACAIDENSNYLVFCSGCFNFLDHYEVVNKNGEDLMDVMTK